MAIADMGDVQAISDLVHGAYSETPEVYGERRALYPGGCFVLVQDRRTVGYLITHPWLTGSPPALNALLGSLPGNADTYYLHDIALLPASRGTGAGASAVKLVVAMARALGFESISLVAINGADRFWASQGFDHLPADAGIGSYGPGAFPMRHRLI